MPDLSFSVISAVPEAHALIPILNFHLRIAENDGHAVDTIALRCQIQIEAARRAYAPREQEALLDLFGDRARWGRTLKTMLWTHATTMVAGFSDQTEVDLPVPCTRDLTVAAGRYFFALEDGEVPLILQFSGTVFWRDAGDALSVSPIAWTKEAAFRLPVATWRALMEEHYPDSAWLCVRRDLIDRLSRYKGHRGLPTWDGAVEQLLDTAEATMESARPQP